jgi:hypothetical protein
MANGFADSFNLAAVHPIRRQGLQPETAESQPRAPAFRQSFFGAAFLPLPMFYLFWLKHGKNLKF